MIKLGHDTHHDVLDAAGLAGGAEQVHLVG
jgi:hypothetical protein